MPVYIDSLKACVIISDKPPPAVLRVNSVLCTSEDLHFQPFFKECYMQYQVDEIDIKKFKPIFKDYVSTSGTSINHETNGYIYVNDKLYGRR
jgi:hypothetical protein